MILLTQCSTAKLGGTGTRIQDLGFSNSVFYHFLIIDFFREREEGGEGGRHQFVVPHIHAVTG